jgi:AcrR family transcriptional regulator
MHQTITPMPDATPLNKRQAGKAATRARIIDCARDLFTSGGYAAGTIRDVANAAGMSTGAIFANFRDKADLWSAVFGGAAPDHAAADKLAMLRGRFPGHPIWICHDGSQWAASLSTPDFLPGQSGARLMGHGTELAETLTDLMAQGEAYIATHAVRSEVTA